MSSTFKVFIILLESYHTYYHRNWSPQFQSSTSRLVNKRAEQRNSGMPASQGSWNVIGKAKCYVYPLLRQLFRLQWPGDSCGLEWEEGPEF